MAELNHKKDKYECIGTVSKKRSSVNFTDFLKGIYLKRYVTYITVYDNVMSIRFIGSTESNRNHAKSMNSTMLVLKTKNGQPIKLDCINTKIRKLKDLCVTNLNYLRRGRWGLTQTDYRSISEKAETV